MAKPTDKAKQLATDGIESLAAEIDAGQSDQLKRYLDTMAAFHKYSFRNCMLIAIQKPEATRVAGYKAWPKLGRHVSKGQKGIVICAPMVYKDKKSADPDAMTVAGFRGVYVFDVSQTEGDDLPSFAEATGEPGQYNQTIDQYIADQKIKLEYLDDMGGPDGCSTGGTIRILAGLSKAKTFAVKVHELAHEFLHHTKEKLTRTQEETEAEAVAYVVCRAIGIETGTAFSDYIQLYKGGKTTLLKSLTRVQQTAAKILTGIALV